jgi:hypothetical protein
VYAPGGKWRCLKTEKIDEFGHRDAIAENFPRSWRIYLNFADFDAHSKNIPYPI